MWNFGNRHSHINPGTLNEYLDGRITGRARERIVLRLGPCRECRAELDSLRATALLLKRLPEQPVPHSFVLAAPPPEIYRVSEGAPRLSSLPSVPQWTLPRVPQWAFAGAVSAAVIVLVSVDASGLLSPDAAPGDAFQTQARSAATALESDQVIAQVPAGGDDGSAVEERIEPAAAPAAAMAAAAEGPATDLAAKPEPESAERASSTTRKAEDSPSAEGAEPPVPIPVSRPPPVSPEKGTAVYWRILEGLVAVVVGIFLIGLLLRGWSARRNRVV